MERRLRIFPTPDALRVGSGLAVMGAMEDAVRTRGAAYVALAGGGTPAGTYGWLADRVTFPWPSAHLFFGDERCVPRDSSENNHRMLRSMLLEKLPSAGPNVYPVDTALPPEEAAARYEAVVRDVVPAGDGGVPVFDLVLLGLGADGHTASLFPATAAVAERKRLVAAGTAPVEPSRRVTMTLPLINAARKVMFLVSGEGKAAVVRTMIEGPPGDYPAQLVAPAGGAHWYLDAAAASLLQERNRP